jgi:hypothetical protein
MAVKPLTAGGAWLNVVGERTSTNGYVEPLE